MKYITIPSDEPILREDGEIRPYSYVDLYIDNVRVDPVWNSTQERMALFFGIDPKLVDASRLKDGRPTPAVAPGDVVALTDAEHEALLPLITLQGKQLGPHVAMPMRKLGYATFLATDKPTEE